MTVPCSNCGKKNNPLPNAFAKKNPIKCKFCGIEAVHKPAASAAPVEPEKTPAPAPEKPPATPEKKEKTIERKNDLW